LALLPQAAVESGPYAAFKVESLFGNGALVEGWAVHGERMMGPRFNLKAFHEEFLSYGSAPVKLVSRLMRAKVQAQ